MKKEWTDEERIADVKRWMEKQESKKMHKEAKARRKEEKRAQRQEDLKKRAQEERLKTSIYKSKAGRKTKKSSSRRARGKGVVDMMGGVFMKLTEPKPKANRPALKTPEEQRRDYVSQSEISVAYPLGADVPGYHVLTFNNGGLKDVVIKHGLPEVTSQEDTKEEAYQKMEGLSGARISRHTSINPPQARLSKSNRMITSRSRRITPKTPRLR